jgi:hypothetical protein
MKIAAKAEYDRIFLNFLATLAFEKIWQQCDVFFF